MLGLWGDTIDRRQIRAQGVYKWFSWVACMRGNQPAGGRGVFRPGRLFFAGLAFVSLALLAGESATAQSISLTPEQRATLNQLPPEQRQQALKQLGQIQGQGSRGSELSSLAEEAGFEIDHGEEIVARTANGATRFATAVISGITVAGRTVENVRVAICEDCGTDEFDGLLGLDVQTPLAMRVDPGERVVHFADCD